MNRAKIRTKKEFSNWCPCRAPNHLWYCEFLSSFSEGLCAM